MPSNLLMWVAKDGKSSPDMLPIPSGNSLNYFEILQGRCHTSQVPVIFGYDSRFITEDQKKVIEQLPYLPEFAKLYCVDYNEFQESCKSGTIGYEESIDAKMHDKVSISVSALKENKKIGGPSKIGYLVDLERMCYLAKPGALHNLLKEKYKDSSFKTKLLSDNNDGILAYTDFDIKLLKPIAEILGEDNFFCNFRNSMENSLIIVKGENNPVITDAFTLMTFEDKTISGLESEAELGEPYCSYRMSFHANFPIRNYNLDVRDARFNVIVRPLLNKSSIPTKSDLAIGEALRSKITGEGLSYYTNASHDTCGNGYSKIEYTLKSDDIMNSVVDAPQVNNPNITQMQSTPTSTDMGNSNLQSGGTVATPDAGTIGVASHSFQNADEGIIIAFSDLLQGPNEKKILSGQIPTTQVNNTIHSPNPGGVGNSNSGLG